MYEDVELLDEEVGAVRDPGGELDTTIYVAKMKLNPNERLNLEIVYTSFKGTSQIQIKWIIWLVTQISENVVQDCSVKWQVRCYTTLCEIIKPGVSFMQQLLLGEFRGSNLIHNALHSSQEYFLVCQSKLEKKVWWF